MTLLTCMVEIDWSCSSDDYAICCFSDRFDIPSKFKGIEFDIFIKNEKY